jgi:hypothetical protein
MSIPRAATRPALTYATKIGRAAWLELAASVSSHLVEPVGMPQCLPGILPELSARGKRRCNEASGAPTRRPFAVCQREPVTCASPKCVQFAGVAVSATSVKNVVERPSFANLSRQEPLAKDEEPTLVGAREVAKRAPV